MARRTLALLFSKFQPKTRRARVEALERRALLASISGAVYVDRNGSLTHDSGDANFSLPSGPSASLYLDLNNNGSLDNGEPTTTTADGNYTFGSLASGTY